MRLNFLSFAIKFPILRVETSMIGLGMDGQWMSTSAKKDFFISYTQADRQWAEWIAWVLEEEGYTTVTQAWDFRPGSNFAASMDEAIRVAERTIAVLSSRYVEPEPGFTTSEWGAAFAQDAAGKKGTLWPVRVDAFALEGLLSQIVYTDLVGRDRASAREAFLADAPGPGRRAKPSKEPAFPGEASKEPDFPGAPQSIRHILHPRNPNFTGREETLSALRAALTQGQTAVLVALSGLGGIGKTQLALEYTYRYEAEYAGVWWFRSEIPESLGGDYVTLACRLGLSEAVRDEDEAISYVDARLAASPKSWLLVYDNAESPTLLKAFLSHTSHHHRIVTSRYAGDWGRVAKPVSVHPLLLEEAILFLRQRTGRNEPSVAETLAEELGRLPLALEQAAAYMNNTGRSVAEYLALFQARRFALLSRKAEHADYPDSVATTWTLSFERVESVSPAGAALLKFLSFLAPDGIPKTVITEGGDALPPPLSEAAKDALELDEAVAALRQHSLLEVVDEDWSVHRLVQVVTRDRLGDEASTWANAAIARVHAMFQYDMYDPATWSPTERLVLHALSSASHAAQRGVGLEAAGDLFSLVGTYLHYFRARLDQSLNYKRRALDIHEQLHGPEHTQVAICANNIGLTLQAQGDLDGALQYTKRALEIHEKVCGPEHPAVAIDANNIGMILQEQGDLDGALQYTKRALEIHEKVYGPEHPELATDARNVGQILQAQGDLDGALQYTKRALEIHEKVYGPEHPAVAIDAHNIGSILRDQGDFDGALQYTKRALEINEKVYGPEHPNVATAANAFGAIIAAQGDLDGALQNIKRALEINEKVYGPEHPNVAIGANNIGTILRDQGDFDGALQYTKRALEIDEKVYGLEHPNVAIRANNIGRILQAQGDSGRAAEWYTRALHIYEKVLGFSHPSTQTVKRNLGALAKSN
jgi:tetratricopeptide (TPR) repeat protein